MGGVPLTDAFKQRAFFARLNYRPWLIFTSDLIERCHPCPIVFLVHYPVRRFAKSLRLHSKLGYLGLCGSLWFQLGVFRFRTKSANRMSMHLRLAPCCLNIKKDT